MFKCANSIAAIIAAALAASFAVILTSVVPEAKAETLQAPLPQFDVVTPAPACLLQGWPNYVQRCQFDLAPAPRSRGRAGHRASLNGGEMQQRGKAMNLLSRAWRFCGGASFRPELFVHDPAVGCPRAYNLDDLFHNAEFQAKVGKLLATARAGEKQPVP